MLFQVFFDVLSFYIMSFLYFCFSMFCHSMFCHRPTISGFIRVREMSGKFKKNHGQGIVREFSVVSGENEILLKCQQGFSYHSEDGNVT